MRPEETEGRFAYSLGDRGWDIPSLRELLEEIIPQNSHFNDFEFDHEFPVIGRSTMLLNVRRIYQEGRGADMFLLALEDITGHSAFMGNAKHDWMDTGYIGVRKKAARNAYHRFVGEGMAIGKIPEFTDGGLIRSRRRVVPRGIRPEKRPERRIRRTHPGERRFYQRHSQRS